MTTGAARRLEGQRVVITGASRGVGLEITRRFLEEGAQILGISRNAERLRSAMAKLDPTGQRITCLVEDVADPAAPARIAAAVTERWNALDVLFNNAGVQLDKGAKGFCDGEESMLTRSLDVNLLAPYRLCMALLPQLLRGRAPRIVNVSSGAGTFAAMRDQNIASYRLSKWALNGFSLLLAAELAGKVAVNAFDPGWVKTDMGGPNAPGDVTESGEAALKLVTLPFEQTGKFWKNGEEIPF